MASPTEPANPSAPTTAGTAAPHHPHRSAVVVGTLMPHMSAERHHVYRNGTALILLAALIAAGFGSLPIALVLAAIALPAIVLTYIHDHRLWRDEPITVLLITFLLSLALGVGVGFLEIFFLPGVALPLSHAQHAQLPPVAQILELGLLVPAVAFIAVLIAPILVTSRAAFKHPMDVVVTSSLSGAAVSLGLSIVVQHGAFAEIQATAGDPARVAFIALTLGFLQPIVLATAAATTLLGLRSPSVNWVAAAIKGVLLVILYELATTLLQPLGTRGTVLIALVAFVLAGAGLLIVRSTLHSALTDDENVVAADVIEHRLHAAVVAAVIVVVVLIAAGVTAAVVWSGPSTKPAPPPGGGTFAPAKALGGVQPGLLDRDANPFGDVVLASTRSTLAVGDASTYDFGGGVTMTIASGWNVTDKGQGYVNVLNGDKTAALFASAGNANTADIGKEATFLIQAEIKGVGLTNVQQDQQAQVQDVAQGSHYLQSLTVQYTGNLQTNQGTAQAYGVWVILFNQTTKKSAFLDAYAFSSDAINAAWKPDIIGMIDSMV